MPGADDGSESATPSTAPICRAVLLTGPDGLALVRLAVALSGKGHQGLQARDDLRDERTRQLQSMLDRARERGEHVPDAFGVLDRFLAPMHIRVLFGMGPLTPDYVDGLVDRLM